MKFAAWTAAGLLLLPTSLSYARPADSTAVVQAATCADPSQTISTALPLRLALDATVVIGSSGDGPFKLRAISDSLRTGVALDDDAPEVLSGPGPLGLRNPWGTITAAAAMVVSGTAAAYFKDRANKAFNQYNRTRDAATLNEIRRNDRYSGFAMLTTQISFAGFAYMLLLH